MQQQPQFPDLDLDATRGLIADPFEREVSYPLYRHTGEDPEDGEKDESSEVYDDYDA